MRNIALWIMVIRENWKARKKLENVTKTQAEIKEPSEDVGLPYFVHGSW